MSVYTNHGRRLPGRPPSGYRRKPRIPGLGFIAAFVVIALLMIAGALYVNFKTTDVRVQITGKESVNTKDGHEYRIYTDGETYKMTDTLLHGRFNTATEYGHLQVGRTYECKAQGLRVGLLSWFQNLYDCSEVAR